MATSLGRLPACPGGAGPSMERTAQGAKGPGPASLIGCEARPLPQGEDMDLVHWFVDFFLHLDRHLAEVIQAYGTWTYAFLFTIVFLETGLVVTPILPGDSLLFAAGSFAALGALDVHLLFGLLCVAAILGDTVNYAIGHYLGPKVFHYERSRFFNPEHLKRTHAFYEKYGGKTIVIARFVPIVRTFAPFVAGVRSEE